MNFCLVMSLTHCSLLCFIYLEKGYDLCKPSVMPARRLKRSLLFVKVQFLYFGRSMWHIMKPASALLCVRRRHQPCAALSALLECVFAVCCISRVHAAVNVNNFMD